MSVDAGDGRARPDTDFDVVIVGSLNLDMVVRADRHPRPGETLSGSDYIEVAGGKGLNQAVAAARSGARIAMIGAVGDDAAGEFLRSIVRAEGIDDSGVITRPALPTGRALITVDAHGENTIVVVPGANETVTVESLPTAAAVLAQLEVPQSAVADAFQLARERGALTLLDPAPAAPLDARLLRHCDVLMPNEHELTELGGIEVAARLVGEVVVTSGSSGATLTSSDHTVAVPSFAVDAIDTTGAGDAFRGTYGACRASGIERRAALERAVAAGALATTVVGAVPSQPRHDAVSALLASDTPRLG